MIEKILRFRPSATMWARWIADARAELEQMREQISLLESELARAAIRLVDKDVTVKKLRDRIKKFEEQVQHHNMPAGSSQANGRCGGCGSLIGDNCECECPSFIGLQRQQQAREDSEDV